MSILNVQNSSGNPDELTRLARQIRRAFWDVPYPGDDSLVYDNTGYHMECAEIRRQFSGKHWSELDLGFLRYHAESLHFMTPAAYRFYLPAFLLASLEHYDEADIIPDIVVSSLTPPPKCKSCLMELFSARVAGFTEPQRAAIRLFLRHLRDNDSDYFEMSSVQSAFDALTQEHLPECDHLQSGTKRETAGSQ